MKGDDVRQMEGNVYNRIGWVHAYSVFWCDVGDDVRAAFVELAQNVSSINKRDILAEVLPFPVQVRR